MKRRKFLISSASAAFLYGLSRAQAKMCPPPLVNITGGGQSATSCGGGNSTGAAVAANTVALVGTNTELSIRPSVFNTSDWEYTLFTSYSGGCFVPGWGTHGAYVICGTGGHQAPENYDAAIFDFSDYTWKYIPNTNGVRADPTPLPPSAVTSPYCEIPGTEVPAPAHVYKHQIGIGNAVYWPTNTFATTIASGGNYLHRYTLNPNGTGTWARIATNSTFSAFPGFGTYGGASYAETIFDRRRNRLWFLNCMIHYVSTIPFIDLSGTSWSGAPITSVASGVDGNGFMIHDDEQDCIFMGTNAGLFRLNLSGTRLAGWTAVTSSGLSSVGLSGGFCTRWHRYPVADGGDGCFYTYVDNGSNTLKRFDPVSRVFSNVTVQNGSPMPRQNPASGRIIDLSMVHYTRFTYVPARKCFAWIAGNGQRVALLRP